MSKDQNVELRKTDATTRPKRTRINGSKNILTVEGKEPGYRYRIVNDTGSRIQMFLNAGYEIVSAKDVSIGDRRADGASNMSGSAATYAVGPGQTGIVMRLKEEYAKEDDIEKERLLQEKEAGIRNQAESYSGGSLQMNRVYT